MIPGTVTLLANAKLNLYLEITGKREDGYHDISTVMQSVTLSDRVTVSRVPGDGILIDVEGDPDVPCDDRNIAVKAARAFFDASGEPFGIRIYIKKNIPSQAGLGGGSADGAAVIRALNILSENKLDDEALLRVAATVGSDLPFCLAGGCRACTGRGENVSGRLKRSELIFLIAKPQGGISTPAAYAALDRLYGDFGDRIPPETPEGIIDALSAGDRDATSKRLRNIFEDVLPELSPEAAEILSLLKKCSFGCGLCGSGSAVYACFLSDNTAITAEKILKKRFPGVFTAVCKGTGHGVRPLN